MTGVTPLHRCGRCGEAGQPVSVTHGDDVYRANACEACIEGVTAFLATQRPIFQALLAVGVARETANVMMTAKLDFERSKR